MRVDELPPFLRIDQAQELTQLGRSQIYELTRLWRTSGGKEGIPVVQFGRCLRIPTAADRHRRCRGAAGRDRHETAKAAHDFARCRHGAKPATTSSLGGACRDGHDTAVDLPPSCCPKRLTVRSPYRPDKATGTFRRVAKQRESRRHGCTTCVTSPPRSSSAPGATCAPWPAVSVMANHGRRSTPTPPSCRTRPGRRRSSRRAP